ncbi:MAG: hypothetical protein V4857_31890 [Pseudomonadota bacterium]
MLKILLIFIVVFFSNNIFACTCSFAHLDTESVRKAKKIFAFRLMGAEIKKVSSKDPEKMEVVGRILVIDNIRGNKNIFKEIRFTTHRCCGSRFDIGSYYVAFISDNGPKFFANSGNVLEIGTMYDAVEVREKMAEIYTKKKDLDDVFSRESRDRIEQSPVLPPCPRGVLNN